MPVFSSINLLSQLRPGEEQDFKKCFHADRFRDIPQKKWSAITGDVLVKALPLSAYSWGFQDSRNLPGLYQAFCAALHRAASGSLRYNIVI